MIAVAAAFGLMAPLARADAESDAKDLFTRGRELRAQGNCVDALMQFRKAAALFPSGLGSLRNIAECEEQVGHFASARRAWLDLKRALLTTQDKKYDGWDAEADANATRLSPRVARLAVEVRSDGDLPAGLQVLVNGEALPASLIGTVLERDPGTYRVRVERPNGPPLERSVTVAAGQEQRVALKLPDTPEGRATPSVPPDPNAPRRLAGWISLGVGGAALVGATVALIVRQSASSDLDASCPSHDHCDPGLQSTVDRGKTGAVLTNVLGGVGLLAAGAGVVLILTSPPRRGAVVVAPQVGSINGLHVTWRLP
jgi:hypothetical protein